MSGNRKKPRRHNAFPYSRPRGSDVRTGSRGGPKTHLTEIQKVLMSKGLYAKPARPTTRDAA